jgi:hypothetical protein
MKAANDIVRTNKETVDGVDKLYSAIYMAFRILQMSF